MVFRIVSHLPKSLYTVKGLTFKGILDQIFFNELPLGFQRETKEHLFLSATEVVTPTLL